METLFDLFHEYFEDFFRTVEYSEYEPVLDAFALIFSVALTALIPLAVVYLSVWAAVTVAKALGSWAMR